MNKEDLGKILIDPHDRGFIMAQNMIIVGMADLNIVKEPGSLVTYGLGSCVGICLYDPMTKIAGMAHIMLPDSTKISGKANEAKFADTGIAKLIRTMIVSGAKTSGLKAKIAGGAQMFGIDSSNPAMRIGDRNVEAVKLILKKLNIPIVANDTGKNYGRTIEFFNEDGRVVVKSIGHGTYVL